MMNGGDKGRRAGSDSATGSVGFLFKQLTLNWIETEDLAYACEAPAVNWRGAQLFQKTTVLRRGITFVRGEVVAWMHRIKFSHQCIARGLGDDRGSRDAGRERVTLDDAALRRRAVRYASR